MEDKNALKTWVLLRHLKKLFQQLIHKKVFKKTLPVNLFYAKPSKPLKWLFLPKCERRKNDL